MTRRISGDRTGLSPGGFTLIELLVVMGIVAVLVAIAFPLFGAIQARGNETKTLSNLRQMGVGMLLYSNDNSYKLPNRVADGPTDTDKWPRLLHAYIEDLRVYGAPIPDVGGASYKVARPDLYLDNVVNNTTYIYNGGNDVQAQGDNSEFPRLNSLSSASDVILLGVPMPRKANFYMDFRDQDNSQILNKAAFANGSPYMFCDGSARMLKVAANAPNNARPPDSGTYTDWLWLFNKDAVGIIR